MPQTIQPMQSPQSGDNKSPLSKALLVILGIIIVAIVAYIFIQMSGNQVSDDGKGNAVITTQPGKVVKTFPQEFLLETDAKIDESFSIKYRAINGTQPVVRYTSKKTFEENIDLFRTTLTKDSWIILHDASIHEVPVTFFYATKDDEQVNITIEKPAEGNIMVQISYLSTTK